MKMGNEEEEQNAGNRELTLICLFILDFTKKLSHFLLIFLAG